MSTKTKTRPGAQQQKLDLRSVKKKSLFKKKDATPKSVVAKSPNKTQVKDEVAIKRVEKKILTKEDLDSLRLFDHNRDYGPCIGMTRLERWNRAKDCGLEPPQEIEMILSWYPDKAEVQECIWSTYKL